MANFVNGETVICSCTVKNSSGTLADPSTSMKITIDLVGVNSVVVNDVAMTKDSTGTYHYDYLSTMRGQFSVKFKATDGARISIGADTFTVI